MLRQMGLYWPPHGYPRAPNHCGAGTGINVLVEKPVAASLAEADEMIAASKRTGKRYWWDITVAIIPWSAKRLKFYPRVKLAVLWWPRFCGA